MVQKLLVLLLYIALPSSSATRALSLKGELLTAPIGCPGFDCRVGGAYGRLGSSFLARGEDREPLYGFGVCPALSQET